MNKKSIMRKIGVVVILVSLGFWIQTTYFGNGFNYAGTVEATRIDLPARVPTVVADMAVQEGMSVKKGQLLAKLSCEDIRLQQKLVQDNYDRAVNLKRSGSISKEFFDLAQNKKQEADTRLSWCEIKSPVDGTVLTKFLEPAEWVNPGTKILTVANLDELWAYFYVPQEVMSKIKLGDKVEGIVPELSRKFDGQVIKVNNEAEFTPKNVQTQLERARLIYGIKVLFKNSDHQLKPGMTIESTLGPN